MYILLVMGGVKQDDSVAQVNYILAYFLSSKLLNLLCHWIKSEPQLTFSKIALKNYFREKKNFLRMNTWDPMSNSEQRNL